MSDINAIWFDCPECGEIDTYSKLREHPTRPIATDVGFCPKCGGEIDELLTDAQIEAVVADYGMTLDELRSEVAARQALTSAGEGMSEKPQSPYEHAGVVFQDGHVDPITGPRCMIKMSEGPHLGLYVIGDTQAVLSEGTPVLRNFITGRARPLTASAGEGK